MTLPTGESPISFSQIRTEFGDGTNTSTSPVRLGQYRRTDASFTNEDVGAFETLPLDVGISTSGTINVDSFHGKKLNVIVDYYSGSTENRPSDARAKYQAASASGNRVVVGGYKDRVINDSSGSKVRIHVNKTIGSAVGNINNCAVRTGSFETGTVVTVEVGSSGAIYGAGGDGGEAGDGEGANGSNGGSGSSGLGVQFSGTTVINNGVISAGYGGGGGGGYRKVEREEMFGGPVYAANGGGGGGGGSNGTGGEGGNNNDGGNGTSSSGGNGADGTHTGSIESENNVQGEGGTGGGNGAAIRRTSGITVNITNNATITGVTNATGVS